MGFRRQALGQIKVVFDRRRQPHGEKAKLGQRQRLSDKREPPWFWTGP